MNTETCILKFKFKKDDVARIMKLLHTMRGNNNESTRIS